MWKLKDKISGMIFEVKHSWQILEIFSDLEQEYKKENIKIDMQQSKKEENTFIVDIC